MRACPQQIGLNLRMDNDNIITVQISCGTYIRLKIRILLNFLSFFHFLHSSIEVSDK